MALIYLLDAGVHLNFDSRKVDDLLDNYNDGQSDLWASGAGMDADKVLAPPGAKINPLLGMLQFLGTPVANGRCENFLCKIMQMMALG